MAFLGPLAFYTATLSPGVAFWDIGEMQTAPYLLGIPHPTGFPLFLAAAWLAGHAPLIGDPAWRVSLMCAAASAAAAWLVWVFVNDVTHDWQIALAAAFVFSAGDIVWTRAIRAEVHDLALACVALAVVASRRAAVTRAPLPLAIAALACGLGLATHPVVLFALPCVLIVGWPALRAARPLELFRALGLALAPLLLYLYFPLRSTFVEAHGLDPNVYLGLSGSAIFDDGSPSSPQRFWHYITGSEFHPGNAFGLVFSRAGPAHVAAFFGSLLVQEFSIPILAFAAAGLIALLFSQTRVALGFITLLIADAAFASNYAVEVDPERYALASFWVVVCCAALGARAIYVAILRERPVWSPWLCAATLLVTLWPSASFAYDDVRFRTAYFDARELGPEVAKRTEDGSVIVATWNFATPLLYDRYVTQTFGTRRIVCGWPPDYRLQLPSWRDRFRHVYFVVSSKYDVGPLAHSLYAHGRWQLAELQ